MPSRELISLNNKQRYGFNVSDTVGPGGTNNTGDVLVVQAMLNYIVEGGFGLQCFGYFETMGGPVNKLPGLTGTLDPETITALTLFNTLNLPKIYGGMDRLIHPASYAGRNLNPFKPIMKITLLHVYARAAAKKLGDDDYTTAMLRMLPRLIPFVINRAFTPRAKGFNVLGGIGALGALKQGGLLGKLAGSGRK